MWSDYFLDPKYDVTHARLRVDDVIKWNIIVNSFRSVNSQQNKEPFKQNSQFTLKSSYFRCFLAPQWRHNDTPLPWAMATYKNGVQCIAAILWQYGAGIFYKCLSLVLSNWKHTPCEQNGIKKKGSKSFFFRISFHSRKKIFHILVLICESKMSKQRFYYHLP